MDFDKTCVLVAGAPAVTQALARLGAAAGADAQAAEINRDALDGAGAGWGPLPADPAFRAGLAARIRALLEADFADAPLFAIGGPSLGRLLPVWIAALEAFGARPVVVAPLTAPGADQLSWLRDALDMEQATRAAARVFVSAANLREAPVAALTRVARNLNLTWPQDPEDDAEALGALLAPGLRAGATPAGPAAGVHEILSRWCADDIRDGDDARLDEARAALDAAAPFLALAAAGGRGATPELARLKRRLNDAETARDEAERLFVRSGGVLTQVLAGARTGPLSGLGDAIGGKARRAGLLRASGVFDEGYYLDANPDVARAGADPALHFLQFGAVEGRAPNPLALDRPEVGTEAGDAVRANGMGPLARLMGFGRKPEVAAPPPAPVAQAAPPAPVVVAENDGRTPHYGEKLDQLIRAAQARLKPDGGPAYAAIRAGFDVGFYVMRYLDVARIPDVDVIQHYLSTGAKQGKDPTPDFSTRGYQRRYPEVGKSGMNPFHHYLTIGRDKGYIAEPFVEFEAMCDIVGRPPHEVQSILQEKRRDIRERLAHGVLGEMVAKAAEFEPLIAQSWTDAADFKIPPFNHSDAIDRFVALNRLQEAAGFRRARFLIVVNRPRWGGARRMEGHIAHALARDVAPEEIVVINTDQDGEETPGRFPEGCRHIDFAGILGHLSLPVRQRVLVEFMRSLRPEAAYIVNSNLLWNALTAYGKALSASMKLFAGLFCNEQNPHGFWNGYPARHFYRHFDVLSGVFTDSHDLAESLKTQFNVPPAQARKVGVLEAPVDPAIPVAPAPAAGRRPQIFWSGRFDKQKRLDILYAVARALPEVDIRMWGETVLAGAEPAFEKPANVAHEGVYAAFADLPLQDCDLWLYTSEWDGVPSLLLEVSMTGLPLVGSRVGGVGEIMKDGLSWPVPDYRNVQDYVTAIRAVLADPAAARAKALALREALIAERTEDRYRETLRAALNEKEPADG